MPEANKMIMNAFTNSQIMKANEMISNGEMVETSTEQLSNIVGAQPVNYAQHYQKPIQQVRSGKKVYRNDPCPCGAVDENGKRKKFKHCCINKEEYNQLVDKR